MNALVVHARMELSVRMRGISLFVNAHLVLLVYIVRQVSHQGQRVAGEGGARREKGMGGDVHQALLVYIMKHETDWDRGMLQERKGFGWKARARRRG